MTYLSNLKAGDEATVIQYHGRDPSRLYDIGLAPNHQVRVFSTDPSGAIVWVGKSLNKLALGGDVASRLEVEHNQVTIAQSNP